MRTFVAGPVNVVGNGLDVVIDVRIEMRAGLAMVARTLNDVEQMRDNTGFNEALAVFIEINAPGIARAFGEKLEAVFGGVIAPDAGVEGACARCPAHRACRRWSA